MQPGGSRVVDKSCASGESSKERDIYWSLRSPDNGDPISDQRFYADAINLDLKICAWQNYKVRLCLVAKGVWHQPDDIICAQVWGDGRQSACQPYFSRKFYKVAMRKGLAWYLPLLPETCKLARIAFILLPSLRRKIWLSFLSIFIINLALNCFQHWFGLLE